MRTDAFDDWLDAAPDIAFQHPQQIGSVEYLDVSLAFAATTATAG